MGLTVEERFEELIQRTHDLLQVIQAVAEAERDSEIDRLFGEREKLLQQLGDDLSLEEHVDRYRHVYETWSAIENQLRKCIESMIHELDGKIGEARQNRTRSNQYDSYMHQMPYGAFVDRRK